jgi:hypothetical protein
VAVQPAVAVADDAKVGERLVEQAPRGADERLACEVLGITWLLADQHHVCALASLTEHRLRRAAIEWAPAASIDCRAHRRERAVNRQEFLRTWHIRWAPPRTCDRHSQSGCIRRAAAGVRRRAIVGVARAMLVFVS